MRTALKDKTLNLYLEGRIDSNNATHFEKEIMDALAQASGVEIILDASALDYISSAGLRVLMKLRREAKKALPVLNVSSEVYDIFEVTGFTELLDVKKKLREISIEGAELIGKGGNGAVYRLDRETIVKVYYGVSNTLEKIDRDRQVSRAVFVQGINTAIPFDVVKVGDAYGVVFEMVEADTLGQFLTKHPEETEVYTHKMVDLLKQMHATEFEEDALPDARNIIYHRINIGETNGLFTHEEAAAMRAFTDSIPKRNTFVHGDYHPGNIMVKDGELILIDVGDSGLGHPIKNLMGMYLLYVIASESGSAKQYCGLDNDAARKLWPVILKEYFGTDDPTSYAKAIAGVATLKLMLGIAVNPSIPDEMRHGALAKFKPAFFENVNKPGFADILTII